MINSGTKKSAITDLQKIKEQAEKAQVEMEDAEHRNDLERAARLRYGTLSELQNKREVAEKRLQQLQKEGTLLKEEVDAEEIASIVAKWTHIPGREIAGRGGTEAAPYGRPLARKGGRSG